MKMERQLIDIDQDHKIEITPKGFVLWKYYDKKHRVFVLDGSIMADDKRIKIGPNAGIVTAKRTIIL